MNALKTRIAGCRPAPTRFLAAMLLASLAMGSGCKSDDGVAAPGTPARDPLPYALYPNVVVHDGLEKDLVAEEPIVEPAAQYTPLSVRVPLRSVADETLRLKYRLVFYDERQKQLTMNPVWQPISFPPRTRRFVGGNAISEKATSWELELRRR